VGLTGLRPVGASVCGMIRSVGRCPTLLIYRLSAFYYLRSSLFVGRCRYDIDLQDFSHFHYFRRNLFRGSGLQWRRSI